MAIFRRTKKAAASDAANATVASGISSARAPLPPINATAANTQASGQPASPTVPAKSPILNTLLQPVSDDQQPLPFDADAIEESGAADGSGARAFQKRRAPAVGGLEDLKELGLPRAFIRQKGVVDEEEYNYAPLYTGEKVGELWRPEGDTLIYLCSKGERRQPSFFVSSHVLSSKSDFFIRAISPIWQADNEIDTDSFPGAKYSLFFGPDKSEDRTEETDPLKLLRHYIIIRNVFACMFESTCVELEGDETLLTDIADRMLMYFEGSDVGVAQELGSFISRSGLWDVRNDPVKALDLLIFASRYKIVNLYKEAFAHVVGMLPRVEQLDSYDMLEDGRLLSLIDDSHMMMTARLNMAMGAMHEFHFKKMWASKAPIYTVKAYVTWRNAYEDFRKFLYNYYTDAEGSKWSSKDLTRSVARDLHDDFCALFDLLVNRRVTTEDAVNYYACWHDYCKVLAAHDKTLNDQPPLPNGLPRLPGSLVTSTTPAEGPVYDKAKLPADAIAMQLTHSYNLHKSNGKPIVREFKAWERKVSTGKKMKEIAERRKGYWLIIYGVLSALAEVIVEDNVHFSEDVEYFLCCETRNIVYWEGDADEANGDGEEAPDPQDTSNSGRSAWGMFSSASRARNATINTAANNRQNQQSANADNSNAVGEVPKRRCLDSYCWKAASENWYQ